MSKSRREFLTESSLLVLGAAAAATYGETQEPTAAATGDAGCTAGIWDRTAGGTGSIGWHIRRSGETGTGRVHESAPAGGCEQLA